MLPKKKSPDWVHVSAINFQFSNFFARPQQSESIIVFFCVLEPTVWWTISVTVNPNCISLFTLFFPYCWNCQWTSTKKERAKISICHERSTLNPLEKRLLIKSTKHFNCTKCYCCCYCLLYSRCWFEDFFCIRFSGVYTYVTCGAHTQKKEFYVSRCSKLTMCFTAQISKLNLQKVLTWWLSFCDFLP